MSSNVVRKAQAPFPQQKTNKDSKAGVDKILILLNDPLIKNNNDFLDDSLKGKLLTRMLKQKKKCDFMSKGRGCDSPCGISFLFRFFFAPDLFTVI